ncbi:MAG: MFS transporter [Lachnospiraceae bacterium]|nr:MFS transporter [Lachnospiraceae bacterium]
MGSLVGFYLMIFLTDTFGVPAGAAGVIMVIASIWDAINDPIRNNSRPYENQMGKIPPLFSVCFCNPGCCCHSSFYKPESQYKR